LAILPNEGEVMKTKQVKREEADARNAAWRELSVEEQKKALYSRPGKCEKQLGKMERN
jgi:hypothetical protein